MYHSFLTHSSADGHLGCCHVLAIVNSAAMNIGVHVPLSLSICPAMGFLGHEPQHARPPCPSPTPRVYPNSCPLSQWCHPTISMDVSLSKFWELMNREAWRAAVHGLQRVGHDWETELNWACDKPWGKGPTWQGNWHVQIQVHSSSLGQRLVYTSLPKLCFNFLSR